MEAGVSGAQRGGNPDSAFRLTSTFLLLAPTLPPAVRTQSVIPAHTRSTTSFFPQCSLGSVGHSGPLGLWLPPPFFFLIAGCIGSLGYWQSLATRESKKQHQWYCIPKESQVPIHYDLRHHNLCMTERMVH